MKCCRFVAVVIHVNGFSAVAEGDGLIAVNYFTALIAVYDYRKLFCFGNANIVQAHLRNKAGIQSNLDVRKGNFRSGKLGLERINDRFSVCVIQVEGHFLKIQVVGCLQGIPCTGLNEIFISGSAGNSDQTIVIEGKDGGFCRRASHQGCDIFDTEIRVLSAGFCKQSCACRMTRFYNYKFIINKFYFKKQIEPKHNKIGSL